MVCTCSGDADSVDLLMLSGLFSDRENPTISFTWYIRGDVLIITLNYKCVYSKVTLLFLWPLQFDLTTIVRQYLNTVGNHVTHVTFIYKHQIRIFTSTRRFVSMRVCVVWVFMGDIK